MMDRHVGLCAALATLVAILAHRASQRKVNHPPSPASLPLLGNLLAMPPGLDHLAYIKLGKQLNSDIIYLRLLGNDIVVLNSAKAASDLLEKRSALYSDRLCPPTHKDPELFDWSGNPGITGYNDRWRHYRRMYNNWLNSRAVTQFNKVQEHQAQLLLRRLLDASERPEPFKNVKEEFYYTMGSTMFQLAYGYHTKGRDDPFFANLTKAINNGMGVVMFTNFYVNLFPALARVPDWFPGTGWKRTIRAYRDHKNNAVDTPYEWTQSQVHAGVAEPSILGALLREPKWTSGLSDEEKDIQLKELGAASFGGGTDTTATALVNFIAAMVSNPHVQTKAQQEIDAALGPNALPSISDRSRLPYVNSLILEVLRWRPVIPTAIPHVCFQDDVYRGYDILKGTIVMGNLWAISRDEKVYPDPETFNPERFLDPAVPPIPSFGWGRRKCPGIYFAESSLFIAIASLLNMYEFSKKKDSSGNDLEPVIEDADNTMVLEIKPFEFEFRPRSERHRQLLRDLI